MLTKDARATLERLIADKHQPDDYRAAADELLATNTLDDQVIRNQRGRIGELNDRIFHLEREARERSPSRWADDGEDTRGGYSADYWHGRSDEQSQRIARLEVRLDERIGRLESKLDEVCAARGGLD